MAYAGLLVYFVLLYIRPQDWVPGVVGLPLELVFAGGTIVIAALGYSRKRHGAPPAHVWLLPAWVLVIFMSDAVHGNFSDAVAQGINYAKHAAICLMIWLVLDTPRKLQGVILFVVLMAAVLGLQGIYMKQHHVGWAGQGMYWDNRIKWVGLWDGANVLALLFVSAMAFDMELAFGKSGILTRLYAVACGVLILSGILNANSRGGYLALLAAIFMYFRRRLGRKGLIVAAVLAAGLLVVGPSRLFHNAENDADDASARHRIDMWNEGFEMVKESPLLGIGKGQFADYTQSLIAHNTLIQNMGETGLVGLFVFIALIYASYKGLLLVKESEALGPRIAGQRRGVMVALTGYLAASTFITTDFDLLYVFLGLTLAVVNLARRQTGLPYRIRLVPKDFRNIGLIMFCGILLMYLVVRFKSA